MVCEVGSPRARVLTTLALASNFHSGKRLDARWSEFRVLGSSVIPLGDSYASKLFFSFYSNDLDHWYRAEKASDPSNAALTGAFFANGGPLYIPKGPAPGMVYDQLTVDQLAAAARAEAEQRIALARGGGFGPAGTEVESQHGEEVPSWARLVVGGDSAGGVDGGLPVWAQEIKDALPPSVLEQMAEGVKVRDPKMVKDALASLSTAEKDRLTEAVKDIPPVGFNDSFGIMLDLSLIDYCFRTLTGRQSPPRKNLRAFRPPLPTQKAPKVRT